MSATALPGGWPADPGHRAAIDTLLEMAAAEHRWGDPHRAIVLLERAEEIVGVLPARYERLRRCDRWSLPHPLRGA